MRRQSEKEKRKSQQGKKKDTHTHSTKSKTGEKAEGRSQKRGTRTKKWVEWEQGRGDWSVLVVFVVLAFLL